MSDKVHLPTPKRRQQARAQGRVAKSKELVSAGGLLALTLMLWFVAPDIADQASASILQVTQSSAMIRADGEAIYQLLIAAAFSGLMMLVPLALAMMLGSVCLSVLQTGPMFTPAKLQPSWQRVSPLAGLRLMFSARRLFAVALAGFKLLVMLAVAGLMIQGKLQQLAMLGGLPLVEIAATIFQLVLECGVWFGLTLLMLAAADYGIAWWQHQQDLMMSEQELREELRNEEGPRGQQVARSQPVQALAE